MSTTFEAATAATILQLVAHGFTVDIVFAGLERRFAARVSIIRYDGTRVAFERGHSLLGTVGAAFEAAMNDREYAAATLDVVSTTTQLMDAWHEMAAIASSFEFVSLRPRAATEAPGIVTAMSDAPAGTPVAAVELVCNEATTMWTIDFHDDHGSHALEYGALAEDFVDALQALHIAADEAIEQDDLEHRLDRALSDA